MKRKILKIAILMLMFTLVYVSIVNAFSFTATMTPSSTTVAESTEFTVNIKITNLDVGNSGINTLSGYLKYDKNIFETLTDSSIDGVSGWKPTYTADSEKVTVVKATFANTEEDVLQITFKTKSGVSGKTGKISFEQITGGNTDTEITAQDISTEITVGNVSEQPVANNTVKNGISISPVNNTKNNSANNTNVANTNKTNNTANTQKPITPVTNSTPDEITYAGVEDTVMYIMGAVIILAIFFYIKFERINKEIK